MGNDGGTVAKRLDIVRLFKNHVVKETLDDKTDISKCRLTDKLLINEPVMGDYKGNLYLKESVLEFLLAKQYKHNKSFDYLRSLKDLVGVSMTFEHAKAICPISKSTDDFIYLRGCGCVISHKLIQKLSDLSNQCPNCSKTFTGIDIVVINPAKDDHTNETNIQLLKSMGLSHSKKPTHSKKLANKPEKTQKKHDDDNQPVKKRKL